MLFSHCLKHWLRQQLFTLLLFVPALVWAEQDEFQESFLLAVNYYFNQPEVNEFVAPERKYQPANVVEQVNKPHRSAQEIWDVLLQNLPLTLEGAYFETASAKLNSEARHDLLEVAAFSEVYPRALLDVAGYTDNVGGAAYNQRLSQQRAKSVQFFLVEHGVSVERIRIKAYGEANPIASNHIAAGRAKNRRVEIRSHIPVEKRTPVTD